MPSPLARPLLLAASLPALPALAEPTVSGGYIGEVTSVIDGGLDRGTVYTGLAWLAAEVEADGWRFRGNLLAPHGTSLTGRYLGDLAVASNIDGDSDPRVQELWLERGRGPWSLRAGLLAPDAEFWALDRSARFVNGGFGAPSTVSLNLPGAPLYPLASAGLRLAFDAGDGATWRLAAVDGDAGDPLDDNRHGLDVDFGQGALAVVEFEQVHDRGGDATPDRWRVAAWRHSGPFVDAGGAPRGASFGVTAGWERALGDNLGGFVRANATRRAASLAPLAVEVGLDACFPDQAPGTFGLALGWIDVDPGLGAAAGIDEPDRELVVEATWALPVGDFTVQPDVQYVHQPGGSDAVDGAWVLALRVAWTFER